MNSIQMLIDEEITYNDLYELYQMEILPDDEHVEAWYLLKEKGYKVGLNPYKEEEEDVF